MKLSFLTRLSSLQDDALAEHFRACASDLVWTTHPEQQKGLMGDFYSAAQELAKRIARSPVEPDLQRIVDILGTTPGYPSEEWVRASALSVVNRNFASKMGRNPFCKHVSPEAW
jgi:hypothetical protein